MSPGSRNAELVATARDELAQSLAELRALARGLHPAILSDKGLEAALGALAVRAPLPVDISVDLRSRPPARVESAAYYLVAEALTNIAKHAHATTAAVHAAHREDALVVEIADDGRGGGQPAVGSGLRGLADRVAALGGQLEISSPRGGGTAVRAVLPCHTPEPEAAHADHAFPRLAAAPCGRRFRRETGRRRPRPVARCTGMRAAGGPAPARSAAAPNVAGGCAYRYGRTSWGWGCSVPHRVLASDHAVSASAGPRTPSRDWRQEALPARSRPSGRRVSVRIGAYAAFS